MEGSEINSSHQLRAQLVVEGEGSIAGNNGCPKLPLEIRNVETVGLSFVEKRNCSLM